MAGYGPDFDVLLGIAWGWGDETVGILGAFAGAANITVGANPPYSANDFLAIYPKFFGPPLAVTLALTSGSSNATLQAADPRLASGQLIAGPDIPVGTSIVSNSGTAVVLSTQATATNTAESTQVYYEPLIPLTVLSLYIALASASVMQSRWQDSWKLGMALYIAHYATLWMQSEGTPATTAGQAAQQGLARGIQVAKAVGDTSVSYQALDGFADWGSWNLTIYGQQFETTARVIGAGAMLIW